MSLLSRSNLSLTGALGGTSLPSRPPRFMVVSQSRLWFMVVSKSRPWFMVVSESRPWFMVVSKSRPWLNVVSGSRPWNKILPVSLSCIAPDSASPLGILTPSSVDRLSSSLRSFLLRHFLCSGSDPSLLSRPRLAGRFDVSTSIDIFH